MTKFNKSLLTAAVVGALAIPSIASAAKYQYVAGQQITYAKDLFVDDTKSIDSPNGLQLIAETSDNTTNRISNIAANDVLTVKVTLGQGATFDSTYPADTLVQLFLEGAQTGGAGAAINYVPGTANYNGNELNFQYTASGAGTIGVAGDYFLQLNSAKIKNLVNGLFTNSNITSQITVQDDNGIQILAGKVDYAKSKWGLVVEADPAMGNVNTTIDVGADPRKTFFSSNGVVGADDQATFNAGSVTLDVAKAIETNGAAPGSYVNNFSATAALPNYNVVSTANIVVKVTGSDLTAFGGNRVWLDQNAGCTKAAGAFTNGVVAAGVATFTSPANSALWQNVTNAPPSPSTVFVCFGANHAAEMQAQNLAGSLEVEYNLEQQRVDPPVYNFDLLPLRLNGTTIIFQNVNPAGNPTAQSFLRLTNNTAQICPITIDAKDDAGKHSGEVKLTLAPHGSKQINSEVLEGAATSAGVTGGFGDGTGKWYVRVTAECADLQASALNRHQDGVVTDLTPEKGNDTWLTPTTKL